MMSWSLTDLWILRGLRLRQDLFLQNGLN